MSDTTSIDAATTALNALLAKFDQGNMRLVAAVDSGTADNYVFAPTPAISTIGTDLLLVGDVANPNLTTTPTLSVAGIAGAIPIVWSDGSPVIPGDVIGKVTFGFSSASSGGYVAKILSAMPPANLARRVLVTGTTTLYVRTDGSDSNNGSANNSLLAFATLTGALAYASKHFLLSGGTLTIQLGIPGTYAPPNALPPTLGTIIIQGDLANQQSYILSGAGTAGVPPVLGQGGTVLLRGLTLSNTGLINHTLEGVNCTIYATNVTFTSSNPSLLAHIQSGAGGFIVIQAGCIFASSMEAIGIADQGGRLIVSAGLALVNAPAFSTATFFATEGGEVVVFPNLTFSGQATGPRYLANLNGIISTFGSGASYLPGSTAGSTASGGQFA